MLFKKLKALTFRPHGKISFLLKLSPAVKLLDIGCGNDSPFNTKQILPNCEYTGIDIGDYNQTKPNLADHYIITHPNNFTREILKFSNSFDVVISSHNLEHCDDRDGTFMAMLRALRIGGLIYLSFPCEASVNFPERQGTLNYYDDETHKDRPPKFDNIISTLIKENFQIIFAMKRYRPIVWWLFGLLCEPFSALTGRKFRGTWEYYGFESIIWARKLR